jgi:hypothetical protein
MYPGSMEDVQVSGIRIPEVFVPHLPCCELAQYRNAVYTRCKESEFITHLGNRLFNFIAPVKLAIFQDSLQYSNSKEPNVAGA